MCSIQEHFEYHLKLYKAVGGSAKRKAAMAEASVSVDNRDDTLCSVLNLSSGVAEPMRSVVAA